VQRNADALLIGPSSVHWTGNALEIAIEELDKRVGVPWQRRVAGRVRVIPETLNPRAFALDPQGRHHWHCLAPRARIEVAMQAPALSWQGSAYLDPNFGSEVPGGRLPRLALVARTQPQRRLRHL
jgi:carotenoid 1,2-hydratase